MPHQSPHQIDIPATDVLSYVFPKGRTPSEQPIWIDAEDTSRSLSPAQLLQWVQRLGSGLDRLGLEQNQVVMMFSSNHIFVPVLYLGVAGSGRIFTGCNPAYGVAETAFQIQNTNASIILVEPPYLDVVLEATFKSSFSRDRIFLFSDRPSAAIDGIKDWSSFLPSPESASSWSWRRMTPDESRTRVAVLNYSSGTTGLPKGVMISHQNIIANVAQSLYMRQLSLPPGTQSAERWLGFLPLYHAYGQLWSITAAAINKTPCFFMRSFSYPSFLSHVQNHRITHLQTAPPVLVMLAKRPETSKFDLSSLQNILCGAAPLSRDLQNTVSEKLGVRIVQTWGMTELTCSSMHVPGGVDDRSGSIGEPDPGCSIVLRDEEGKEVGVGEAGEVHVRGPNVCLGYWRNEAATSDTFDSQGYLRTGDVAVRDERGWYWIVDRRKELIKVSGFQVAPAELEAVLLEHDAVADAAVVGIQGDGEERPAAYVVPAEGAKIEARELVAWMAGRVAKHKRLTAGVQFVEEIPKSASGKIVRKTLREWAKRDANPRAKL